MRSQPHPDSFMLLKVRQRSRDNTPVTHELTLYIRSRFSSKIITYDPGD